MVCFRSNGCCGSRFLINELSWYLVIVVSLTVWVTNLYVGYTEFYVRLSIIVVPVKPKPKTSVLIYSITMKINFNIQIMIEQVIKWLSCLKLLNFVSLVKSLISLTSFIKKMVSLLSINGYIWVLKANFC